VRIDPMQRRDRRVHRVEIGGAVDARDVGEGCVPEDAALDHLHDKEPAADHRIVGAEPIDMRCRKSGRAERL
jgi:hypothetical protein